jgi:hypothetical protein
MTFACPDLEAALRDEEPGALEAARAHAETCPACRQTLSVWDEIAAAVPVLRREWSSPDLWPRIQEALAEESQRREHRALGRGRLVRRLSLAMAAGLVLAVAARVALRGLGGSSAAPDAAGRFLTQQVLQEVERSEAEYVASIDRLAKLAGPRLQAPTSPLLARYGEKLRLLDAAIADCRAEIDRNRFNTHLRRELLAIYQEKQQTLRRLMEEDT